MLTYDPDLPLVKSPPIAPSARQKTGVGLVIAIGICVGMSAHARPADKWAQASPERQQFFRDAKMPMAPGLEGQRPQSCCGDADAYETDDFSVTPDGQIVAIVTCNEPGNCPAERDDGDGGTTPSLPVGTRIVIPADRILLPHQPENHTGHGWTFVSEGGRVYCYALPNLY